jgi:transposase
MRGVAGFHGKRAHGPRLCSQPEALLGLGGHEVFVPQSYDWGVEAQVDWYESYADLDGERTKLQVFEMRSMASGGAFHRAYTHATQQAFLEAHELAFRYFGGVFRLLRYDNLSSAVKKILRGHRREETSRFIASVLTGAFRASSAIRLVATRRAASKARAATSAATTGCLCRKLAASG